MIPTGQDSLRTRSTLKVEGKTYAYYSLKKAGETLGDVERLPFSMKVLLENLLRFEDGETVTKDDLQCMVGWLKERRRLCTRFEKLAQSYLSMVQLAFIERCFQHLSW